MNRRDRATVIVAGLVAVTSITAGVVSGAYRYHDADAALNAEPAHALPCAAFADGAPSGEYIGGVCYLPDQVDGFPTIDTSDFGTDIPRCATDDSNTTGLPRCYTEAPGSVIIINSDDETVATLR